jgi:hypothetical protein
MYLSCTRYVLSTYFVWTSSTYFVWTSERLTPSELLLYKHALEYRYKVDLHELGERMFGSEANAWVSFQICELRYVPIHDEYILSTYLVHTRYILDMNMFCMLQGWRWNSSTLLNLTTAVSGKAADWRVLGMMPSLRKSATLEQTDT